jgi:hypothetical protein
MCSFGCSHSNWSGRLDYRRGGRRCFSWRCFSWADCKGFLSPSGAPTTDGRQCPDGGSRPRHLLHFRCVKPVIRRSHMFAPNLAPPFSSTQLTHSDEPVIPSILCSVEIHVAIICSTIPTLRPIVRRLFPCLLGTYNSSEEDDKLATVISEYHSHAFSTNIGLATIGSKPECHGFSQSTERVATPTSETMPETGSPIASSGSIIAIVAREAGEGEC